MGAKWHNSKNELLCKIDSHEKVSGSSLENSLSMSGILLRIMWGLLRLEVEHRIKNLLGVFSLSLVPLIIKEVNK